MRGKSIFSILLILSTVACLDRIDFDIGNTALTTVVIEGYISDEPGPYKIKINSAFDLESKVSLKTPITAERVVISDDQGRSEVLSEVKKGVYQTDTNGIRGTIGRVYKLHVEFSDGRIYESKADTILLPGKLDSIYFTFKEGKTAEGATSYGFDVYFIPSSGSETNYHFLWKFTGTFQADTNPEFGLHEPCGDITCEGCNMCNYRPLCSGIRNVSSFPGLPRAVFIRVGPCECCTCWYNFFNTEPMLSDDQLVKDGRFSTQKAMYVPLNGWTFKYKVHAKVSQMSLSRRAFDFWKGIKDQKSAVNSLFQPVTGRIQSNFVQISGPSAPVEGLFFATGVTSKAIFIERSDVPNETMIPTTLPFGDSCLKLFPYATTEKPDFWD